ncbi:MAG TPA: GNAT family N-acetyltransferase [Candidatus Udaeobacter sp.]|nr:GNAT family N-acetyltransferase [Candidatus Udaeobacter sp.]
MADPDSAETTDLAHRLQFKFVDVRVRWCVGVHELNEPTVKDFVLRTVCESDIAALQEIARQAHQDSRFFFDTNFSRTRAEDLFAAWIAKDYAGRADKVFTLEYGNSRPLGYVTCILNKGSRVGEIGLVGVAADFRRKGAGTTLISSALEWFQAAGAQKVFVVTQMRNIAAHRLYQASGFRIESVKVWYHRWF